MPLFLGIALAAVGALAIVAGVEGRGSQLFSTVTGKPLLGAAASGSAGSAPAGYTPAGGGTGAGVTYA